MNLMDSARGPIAETGVLAALPPQSLLDTPVQLRCSRMFDICRTIDITTHHFSYLK
jgi:hypothetical protein